MSDFLFERSDSPERLAAVNGFSRQWVHKNMRPRPKPRFDRDGYPNESTLEMIRSWEVRNNFTQKDLRGFCKEAWNWGDTMWGYRRGCDGHRPWIAVSTGGWSGNEAIIEALEANRVFWAMSWLQSVRGGHHRFYTSPFEEGGAE